MGGGVPALTADTKPWIEDVAIATLASLGFLDEHRELQPLGHVRLASLSVKDDIHPPPVETSDRDVCCRRGSIRLQFEEPAGSFPCTFVARQGDHVRVEFGDRIVDAVVVVDREDTIAIFLDQRRADVHQPDPLSARDDSCAIPAIWPATVAGLVTQVSVTSGDRMRSGAPLLAIEAMKIERVVRAPRDGVIDEILVAPSDRVEQGAGLLKLIEESR